MIINKIAVSIFVFFLLSPYGFAQNDGAGNTGLAFLKLGAGARAISMGEAFSSVTDDATAFIYNPARLTAVDKNNVALMHNQSVMDLKTDYIAAKFVISKKLFLGVGLFTTSLSGIEIRNIPGAAIDNTDSRNMSTGISFGYKFSPDISAGITWKYLFEKIYVDEASGFAFDFGANYSKKNLNLALVFSNLGSMNELLNQSSDLPASVRFGGSYSFSKDKFGFLLSLDGYKILNGGNFHANTGAEAGYNKFVFLRLGYQTGYDNRGFTSGIGFSYKGINLDYAFVPYSSGFGNSNTISLGLNF
jgi:hypothetical protein